MLVEHREEHSDIFEACVHALSVERDHGVCGIAKDDYSIGEVIGTAFD